MKEISNFIKESSSIFYNDMSDMPVNYLDYNSGDKTFGELKTGDTIYYQYFNNGSTSNIVEVKVKKEGIQYKNNYAIINIEPYKTNANKRELTTYLTFGPKNASRDFRFLGNDGKDVWKSYSVSDIENSSVCVNAGGNYVFGTNREVVIKFAKSGIANKIAEIKKQIANLQITLDSLNKEMENIL